MKTPRLLLGLATLSLLVACAARAQTSTNPPATQFGPSAQLTRREPVFAQPYLRPDEVDVHAESEPATASAAQDLVHRLINSRADLCVQGLYDVRVVCIVDVTGRPAEIQWTQTNNLAFAAIEMAGVARYHFAPATLNGRPVPCLKALDFREQRPFTFTPVPIVPGPGPSGV